MAVELFLVIPANSGSMAVSDIPTTDAYFSATFPSAMVIPVIQYAFATENPSAVGSASGGADAGKEKFDGLQIQKAPDKASPTLLTFQAEGAHFSTVQLYVRHAGSPKGQPFLAYEFQMVFITKIDWTASNGDAQVIETLSLTCDALAIAYQTVNADGTVTRGAKSGWSQLTSSPTVQDTLAIH